MKKMFKDTEIYTAGNNRMMGHELNKVAVLIKEGERTFAYDIAEAMRLEKRKHALKGQGRTWTQGTVWTACRIIKEQAPSFGWYLLSNSQGYEWSKSKSSALDSALGWVQHGETMIETAKVTVRKR